MKQLVAAFAAWVMSALMALSLEAPASSEQVVLRVTGNIAHSNVGDIAAFDRAMLEGLEWREVETFTSFTEGPQVFAGPTLASVLDAVGVTSGMLTARAINDYSIQLPVKHARAHDVLLAMDHNGKPMRVRDKGPIWIVYPLGEEDARKRPFDGEMVWQLVELRADG